MIFYLLVRKYVRTCNFLWNYEILYKQTPNGRVQRITENILSHQCLASHTLYSLYFALFNIFLPIYLSYFIKLLERWLHHSWWNSLRQSETRREIWGLALDLLLWTWSWEIHTLFIEPHILSIIIVNYPLSNLKNLFSVTFFTVSITSLDRFQAPHLNP